MLRFIYAIHFDERWSKFIQVLIPLLLNWYSLLLQDGKIEAEVKLTGILSLGALLPGESRKYGTTIAPGLYAPVHQHFFVARMDMAIDCKPNEALNQVCVTYIGNLFFGFPLSIWLF